jgi:hypothetical protein
MHPWATLICDLYVVFHSAVWHRVDDLPTVRRSLSVSRVRIDDDHGPNGPWSFFFATMMIHGKCIARCIFRMYPVQLN